MAGFSPSEFMTKAEEMLYKALKQESVKLTKYQTDSILNSIQATIDLNEQLEKQKETLAENAKNANEIFNALSKSSKVERRPEGVPQRSKGFAKGSPLDKFIAPEDGGFFGSEAQEAELLEE